VPYPFSLIGVTISATCKIMTVPAWLAAAAADAERRGLPQLKPLLETLARSTEALRRAEAQVLKAAPEPPPEDAE